MAKTQRATNTKPAAKKGRVAKAAPVKITLPTSTVEASGDLNDFAIMIHGVKKIGKTSLALQGGQVLTIQFDPPQIAYDRIELTCTTWKDFNDVLKALEAAAAAGKYPYDRVVLDRVDLWYDAAMKQGCKELAIDHPSEEAYGKGWNHVEKLFADGVTRLLGLPGGKWFLTHSTVVEEEDRHGETINVLKPTISKAADKQLNGRVDGWLAYVYEGDRRGLLLRGGQRTGAGHRMDGRFLTPTGERLDTIDLGGTAAEGYENFVAAFNNEQTNVDPLHASLQKTAAAPKTGRKKTTRKKSVVRK